MGGRPEHSSTLCSWSRRVRVVERKVSEGRLGSEFEQRPGELGGALEVDLDQSQLGPVGEDFYRERCCAIEKAVQGCNRAARLVERKAILAVLERFNLITTHSLSIVRRLSRLRIIPILGRPVPLVSRRTLPAVPSLRP